MATDAEIRARGIKYLPQQKYLQNPYEFPVEEVVEETGGGITNTNAFNNSGNDGFNSAGNAFGYGSPVNEVNVRTFNPQSNDPTGSVASAQEEYNQLGDIKDKSIYSNYADINNQIMDNRQNYQANYKSPYEDSIDLGYQGTLGNKGRLNRFRNKVGDVAKFAGALLPFPLNVATKFLPRGDDNGIGGGSYGIAGLSDAQKEAYNTLAKDGMLFSGSSGMKTLTGKNFTGKGYMQGQRDIYNKEFAGMTDEEIEDLKNNPKQRFKYKQYLESSALFKEKIENDKKLQKAEKNRLQGLIGTRGTDRNTGTTSTIQGESGGNTRGTSRASDHGKSVGLGHNAGNVRSANAAGTGSAQGYNQNLRSGGRAGYFFGGRARLQGGGMSQGNEENQKQSAEMGNTTVSNNNDSGKDNPPNFFVEDKTSIVDTSGLKSKSPEININYTDPKNYASLKSRVYNTNILENDDLNVDGTLSGEIGPVSYNTNFTDEGITNTNLTANNFNADIDANKNYSIGYANNYNGIDYGAKYDSNGNLMFNAGVKFKNGGLASIL